MVIKEFLPFERDSTFTESKRNYSEKPSTVCLPLEITNIPLYRMKDTSSCIDSSEKHNGKIKDVCIKLGYNRQGVACYILFYMKAN